MAITFLEAGGNATYGTEPWTAIAGTVTIDSGITHTGLRSIKCDSTVSNVASSVRRAGVLADAGRRISNYRYFAQLPTTDANIVAGVNAANSTTIWRLQLQTTGKFRFVGSANGAAGSVNCTTAAWVRISVSCTISSTSVNEFRAWMDTGSGPVLIATATNLALAAIGTDQLQLGYSTAPGASVVTYVSDVYVDDSAALTDPGDVRVTAKLPTSSNVSTNFGNIGTGAVNERTISTANGRIGTAATICQNNYNIQAAAAGDADISSATYVGYLGWVWAARSSGTAGSPVDKITVNGTDTAITTTTTAAFYSAVATSASYPSNVAGIGINRTTAGTQAINWYEGGVIVAYIPSSSASLTPNAALTLAATGGTSVLGLGLTPALGTLSATGQTPAAPQSLVLTPGKGSAAFAGSTSLLDLGLTPSRASLAVSGAAPVGDLGITPLRGTFTATGATPAAVQGLVLVPASGSFVSTGQASSAPQGLVSVPVSGSGVFTGASPAAAQGIILTPSPAPLSIPGAAGAGLDGTVLIPAAGALAVTGFAGAFDAQSSLTPLSGSLLAGGQAGILDFATTPASRIVLAVGQAGALVSGSVLVPAAGAAAITAGLSALLIGEVLALASGGLALTGSVSTLQEDTRLTPAVAALAGTGFAGSLSIAAGPFTPGAGTISASGFSPGVIFPMTLLPGSGSGALTGFAGSLARGDSASFHPGGGFGWISMWVLRILDPSEPADVPRPPSGPRGRSN